LNSNWIQAKDIKSIAHRLKSLREPTADSTQSPVSACIRIYTSMYCSLGFLATFVSALLYFKYSEMGRTLAEHSFFLQACSAGIFLTIVCTYLTSKEDTWLLGHRVLVLGLLSLEFALQWYDGYGIRCPSMLSSLLILCYVGLARGRKALLQMFVVFEMMYIVLFLLEWWGYIPGTALNKQSLPITLFLYCSLAGTIVLCMMAKYKEESLMLKSLREEQSKFIELQLAEKEKEALYQKQLTVTQIKDQCMSFLGHEIKNPLLAMQSAIDLLDKGAIPPESKDWIIQSFGRQIRDLLPIVNNILEAGRLDSPSIRVSNEEFNLRVLCETSLETYRPIARDKGIDLTLGPGIRAIRLIGDPVKIRQMVGNYVSNAIKYSQASIIQLDVDLSKSGSSNIPGQSQRLMTIKVSDNGIGVNLMNSDKLFGEYYQGDQPDRALLGTGLGLSIVKRLSQLMGGDVGVQQSHWARGATFWFSVNVGLVVV
jgi:signal transduction histidine kinase